MVPVVFGPADPQGIAAPPQPNMVAEQVPQGPQGTHGDMGVAGLAQRLEASGYEITHTHLAHSALSSISASLAITAPVASLDLDPRLSRSKISSHTHLALPSLFNLGEARRLEEEEDASRAISRGE